MKNLVKSLKSKNQTILYFYNKSCEHCGRLKPKIKLLESKNPQNFFLFNTYKDEEISESFQIEYIPTLIIVENKEITKLEGYEQVEQFYELNINSLSNTKRNL
tara:strand:+ start:1455 stop:1763 length:309 start_codon:yes stop_codon:yes gene_type:complete